MRSSLYAHSIQNQSKQHWHHLETHLHDVAALAARFSQKFGAGDWGRAAGLLHDIGKCSGEFQSKLDGAKLSVDHSTAGARIAAERFSVMGRLLAYVIAGHHAGLANGTGESVPRCLEDRLSPTALQIPRIGAWEAMVSLPALSPPSFRPPDHVEHHGISKALFVRMLFSALVDADRLDTEEFYRVAEERGRAPRGNWRPLRDLKTRLDAFMLEKARASTRSMTGRQNKVNEARALVLANARAASDGPPGIFSLRVPTGGGKTLASLTFALDHAIKHDLDRVIYVIPFTSIIEQTAGVFRDALGPDLAEHVIEHHSAFREEQALEKLETAGGGESGLQAGERLRLATENWDAPIVVTTAVQFFESLFGNKTSRCRKLHNVAKSVVILDEAQTLPLNLLQPTVAAIDELARNYKTTVVLCTATQPALNAKQKDGGEGFAGGFTHVREIVDDPETLYRDLERVTVKAAIKTTDEVLASSLARLEKVLCIVGTRRNARELYQHLIKTGCSTDENFHLSALMCPAHRSARLAEIRRALLQGPCRVIATTVVEAGVDIDFPIVWRQMAGLDSIAQAAGRCNREGKLAPEEAIVQLFEVEGWRSIKELRLHEDTAREVLRHHGCNPLGLGALHAYFEGLYWRRSAGRDNGLDEPGILPKLNAQAFKGWFPFADVARDYKLIESAMEPVIIPWDDAARAAIARLEDSGLPAEEIRDTARKLQPYIVNTPRDAFSRLGRAGRIEPINPHRFETQFMRLSDEGSTSLYSEEIGFFWDDDTFQLAENLVL